MQSSPKQVGNVQVQAAAYAEPRLVTYGSVEQLTQHFKSSDSQGWNSGSCIRTIKTVD